MIRLLFLTLLALAALPQPPAFSETSGSYAIQVDVFKDLQRAKKKTELLKNEGIEAFWKEETSAGKPKRYIVYIGNYASRQEAREEAKRLKQGGVLTDYSIKTLKPEPPGKPPQAREKSSPEKREPDLIISEIVFKPKAPGKEAVWIQGNAPFTPSAFALEEDNPRFVIDIKDTRPLKQDLSLLAAQGQCIERIRSFYHQENRTLRVVLDLQPSKNYHISQFFYQAQNIYAVEVEAKGP